MRDEYIPEVVNLDERRRANNELRPGLFESWWELSLQAACMVGLWCVLLLALYGGVKLIKGD